MTSKNNCFLVFLARISGVLGCSGLFWAVLGCSGLFWAVLVCSELFWAVVFSCIFTYFHIFFMYFHVFSLIFMYFHVFSFIFMYFHEGYVQNLASKLRWTRKIGCVCFCWQGFQARFPKLTSKLKWTQKLVFSSQDLEQNLNEQLIKSTAGCRETPIFQFCMVTTDVSWKWPKPHPPS